MARIYIYPRFSTLGAFGFRFGGPGLGNLLFPYARALVLAKQYGWTLINPSWTTMKLGPLLRGERDARWYPRVFKARGISGPKKTVILLTRPKVAEGAAVKSASAVVPGSVVLTSGLGNFFKDIAHEREYISREFRSILLAKDAAGIAALRASAPQAIGVHIRLGDFQAHQRAPLSWYGAMIEKIRRAASAGHSAGAEVPVIVASDGSDAELAELLKLPGVRRSDLDAAGDMFALSECTVLLASHSTFSAWAAFLGHTPVLWPQRGPELDGIFTDDTVNEVLAADAELPPRLIEQLRRKTL